MMLSRRGNMLFKKRRSPKRSKVFDVKFFTALNGHIPLRLRRPAVSGLLVLWLRSRLFIYLRLYRWAAQSLGVNPDLSLWSIIFNKASCNWAVLMLLCFRRAGSSSRSPRRCDLQSWGSALMQSSPPPRAKMGFNGGQRPRWLHQFSSSWTLSSWAKKQREAGGGAHTHPPYVAASSVLTVTGRCQSHIWTCQAAFVSAAQERTFKQKAHKPEGMLLTLHFQSFDSSVNL